MRAISVSYSKLPTICSMSRQLLKCSARPPVKTRDRKRRLIPPCTASMPHANVPLTFTSEHAQHSKGSIVPPRSCERSRISYSSEKLDQRRAASVCPPVAIPPTASLCQNSIIDSRRADRKREQGEHSIDQNREWS